ncbi:hypothetical protein PMAC_001979 [Pneumocystis sp. 'macacae']|nr:hypothetical protein PMAC_001979 [Pneumocystis sp. 'macacae']
MSIQEFSSNNPFRSILMASTAASEGSNPFLDKAEYKKNTDNATSVTLKPISSHVSSRMISSRDYKSALHSKQETGTMVSRHECSRSNSESNVLDSHKNAHRDYKHFPFNKEKIHERTLLEENSKEKIKSSVYDKGRRSRTHVDRIDLLDVTAVYGSGAFHHDGPFDACNPCRNKNSRKDPLFAFPKDSTSMSFVKLETESSGFPIDKYFGRRDIEAYNEFSPSAFYSRKKCSSSSSRSFTYEPTQKVELLHGSESTGLGTPTFIEGSYASRVAMQCAASLFDNEKFDNEKNEKENRFFGFRGHSNIDNTDLNCKRSFVQRIRGSKKNSQSNDSSIQGLVNSSLGIPKQLDVEKSTFNSKKKKGSVPQSTFSVTSSDNSESCGSKGFLNRVRSLKVGGTRNSHTEN